MAMQIDRYIVLTSVIDRTPIELPEEHKSRVDELGKELFPLTDPKPTVAPSPVVVDQQQPVSWQQPNFALDKTILPNFKGKQDLVSYQVFKEQFQPVTSGGQYSDGYLQMLLASEHVIKDDVLRLQLMQISSHTE